MSATAIRLYRMLLVLYPADFRRRHRDEMIQLLLDRQRHEQQPTALALIHEAIDAVRTAPRLRWESPMNRTVIIVAATTLAIAAAIVAHVLLIPLALVTLAAWLVWGRRARPLGSTTPPRRWISWLVAGAVAIIVAVTIPAIDGGELNESWWTITAAALLSGIAMTVTAVVMAANARAHRLAAPH